MLFNCISGIEPKISLIRHQSWRNDPPNTGKLAVNEPGPHYCTHQQTEVHGSLANQSNDRRIGLAFFFIPTHVRSTIGRRSAMLVHGEDRYGYWDADPIPRFDMDPVCVQRLHAAWDEYRDVGIKQAAASGHI